MPPILIVLVVALLIFIAAVVCTPPRRPTRSVPPTDPHSAKHDTPVDTTAAGRVRPDTKR
jgi:hypothetical protein